MVDCLVSDETLSLWKCSACCPETDIVDNADICEENISSIQEIPSTPKENADPSGLYYTYHYNCLELFS